MLVKKLTLAAFAVALVLVSLVVGIQLGYQAGYARTSTFVQTIIAHQEPLAPFTVTKEVFIQPLGMVIVLDNKESNYQCNIVIERPYSNLTTTIFYLPNSTSYLNVTFTTLTSVSGKGLGLVISTTTSEISSC